MSARRQYREKNYGNAVPSARPYANKASRTRLRTSIGRVAQENAARSVPRMSSRHILQRRLPLPVARQAPSLQEQAQSLPVRSDLTTDYPNGLNLDDIDIEIGADDGLSDSLSTTGMSNKGLYYRTVGLM